MRHIIKCSVLCLGICFLVLGLGGPNAFGQCLPRILPACPCPCPQPPSCDNQCIPYDGHRYWLQDYSALSGRCGTCEFYYDDAGGNVWRFTKVDCISDCNCVLPAVYKGDGAIITQCTKGRLSATEFDLTFQVASGNSQTLRFRLPSLTKATYDYSLLLGGRTWNVSVLYRQEFSPVCETTPPRFPHDLSSTITTNSSGTFQHTHNEANGNCMVHQFGDFQVMITLEQ